MQARSVEFDRGAAWFGEGWRIFIANPGLWIVLVIVLVVISVALSQVPILGQIALDLVFPALCGGLFHAAHELAQGRKARFEQFFIGLSDDKLRKPLLVLGAMLVGVHVLLFVLGFIFVGGSMGMASMSQVATPEMMTGMGVGMLAMLLLFALFGMVVGLAFFYAVPLVMFDRVAPLDAVKSSVAACFANVLPLVLFGIIYVVLAIVAMIPLGLGMLVFVPVAFGAAYASYREVYHGAATPPALEVGQGGGQV
ncbi:MAG: hypothetical protein HYS20_06405 [Rhodocyclales bacterium]|nr:hypothetical protein [Rhodocyclales bacterium]